MKFPCPCFLQGKCYIHHHSSRNFIYAFIKFPASLLPAALSNSFVRIDRYVVVCLSICITLYFNYSTTTTTTTTTTIITLTATSSSFSSSSSSSSSSSFCSSPCHPLVPLAFRVGKTLSTYVIPGPLPQSLTTSKVVGLTGDEDIKHSSTRTAPLFLGLQVCHQPFLLLV